jgi:hypothetical protein
VQDYDRIKLKYNATHAQWVDFASVCFIDNNVCRLLVVNLTFMTIALISDDVESLWKKSSYGESEGFATPARTRRHFKPTQEFKLGLLY